MILDILFPQKEKERRYFLKKVTKKLLLITAFEWPCGGHTNALGIGSFLRALF
jgi:hypothetical protein